MGASGFATRSRPRAVPRGLRRVLADARVLAAVFALMGAVLLALAIPRVIAQALLLPARPALERLHRGERLDAAARGEAAQALAGARRFQPRDSAIAIDLALLELSRLRETGLADEGGRAVLLSAIENLEAGLALGPANAFAWSLLAQARLVRDGRFSDGAREALRVSYYMGPFDHGAMLVRSELVLPHWAALDAELKTYAQSELRDLWLRSWDDQKALIHIACGANASFVLSDALRASAPARAEFDKLYAPYLSPDGCRKGAP